MQEYETNAENVAIIRKEVSKTLRTMPVNEKTDFDIIQLDSVRVSIQRLQKKLRGEGLKWSTTTNDNRIEVTRVA